MMSVAPALVAIAMRSGTFSMAMMRSAPMILADWMAKRPTGPAPQIATMSPPLTSAWSAACQPVGRMSVRNSIWSSVMPSGTTIGATSAIGTRTYSAWPPEKPPVICE